MARYRDIPHVPNWTDEKYPQPWWDTPGLPPRGVGERCARHKLCAYRDDDPARCSACHAIPKKCSCGKVFDE